MIVHWRKSSYSGSANDDVCVELGRLAPGVGIGVRDSKDPGGEHLTLSVAQFAGLIEQVKRLSER
ncbi:DUF397 domain-containing protein [Actinomadura madurae]|uniref:DUF397 domain-containing protein n=1 Tax=Actinomadura madurae TaxID=1993 RepID=UPI002026FDCE|nr:DUF397 domain-containing protein [Actinomadura madurae]URM95450.1 DUF397 domain-containing protein [Actinomadura madurae]URN06145.1 DUF397 domain-containing protein [Actinomadura madurae]